MNKKFHNKVMVSGETPLFILLLDPSLSTQQSYCWTLIHFNTVIHNVGTTIISSTIVRCPSVRDNEKSKMTFVFLSPLDSGTQGLSISKIFKISKKIQIPKFLNLKNFKKFKISKHL